MRKQLLALMISVPLVASGAAGTFLHVCQSMGGVVVGDCGCDTQASHGGHAGHGDVADHASHETGARLGTQPCCTVELSQPSQLVATQEVSRQHVDHASVALVDRASDRIAASREICDVGLLRRRAPPNLHGPPIFVRNCSFLN